MYCRKWFHMFEIFGYIWQSSKHVPPYCSHWFALNLFPPCSQRWADRIGRTSSMSALQGLALKCKPASVRLLHSRRKFRSQTSGNMDRWKSRGGKSQRGEEQKREDQRRERVRRKKMQAQVREKVAKSRNTVFFQCFVAPEGRKVGSLKRRVRSHVVRWEMKNCTPLWREAHFHVKMYNAHQGLSTLARYKRHAHQRYQEVRVLISWEHFGASDLQVC